MYGLSAKKKRPLQRGSRYGRFCRVREVWARGRTLWVSFNTNTCGVYTEVFRTVEQEVCS